jgi:predicted small secreted protein
MSRVLWCWQSGDAPARSRRNKAMLRKILAAATLGALALTATACNTVRGVGDDVKSVANAGDKVI